MTDKREPYPMRLPLGKTYEEITKERIYKAVDGFTADMLVNIERACEKAQADIIAMHQLLDDAGIPRELDGETLSLRDRVETLVNLRKDF